VDHCGLDVHKNETQICTITEAGELLEKRIKTTRERFRDVFEGRPRLKILLEASTESEWVARYLETFGHEVIVADPNYAPMYVQRSRRIKTDRRDAQALAEACRLGVYRPAHRTSDAQRHIRALLSARDALVRTRVRWIMTIRPLLRSEGLRVRTGATETFGDRVRALDLPDHVQCEIAPLLALLPALNEQIRMLDQQLVEMSRTQQESRRLTTAPGVGPVTALSFVATLDRIQRFRGAHQVESYLGLVPREWSSSETQRRGPITKSGNSRTRWLLVQAAHCIRRYSKQPQAAGLREWADRIAQRRGRAVATVALARKLAGILYAMWRDGVDFDASKLCSPGVRPAA